MFETLIQNKRPAKAILYDTTGRIIAALAPGDSIVLDSETDLTIVAPLERIVFERSGEVTTKRRDDWTDPYDKRPWRVEIVNYDGQELYQRVVGGEAIFLPRGIPIVRYVDAEDPDARFERIEVRRAERRVPHPSWPGYYGRELCLEEVKTERSEEDLKKLDDELAALAQKAEQADDDTEKVTC